MRKRRLYRYAQAQAASQQAIAADYPFDPMNVRRIFNAGMSAGLRMAEQQQNRVLAEHRRETMLAIHHEPFMVMARRSGYDEGFAVGMRAANRADATKAHRFTYQDVEDARRRGFTEGQSAAPKSSGGPDRNGIIDDMLEQCRIIAESNPNMAPGVNAVRHRIKKLKI